jgi:hypothetical protein
MITTPTIVEMTEISTYRVVAHSSSTVRVDTGSSTTVFYEELVNFVSTVLLFIRLCTAHPSTSKFQSQNLAGTQCTVPPANR